MLDRLQILNYENFNPSFIVDIGAHIGDFARECKRLWPKTDIHMFEANPNAREVLEQTGYPYTIDLLKDILDMNHLNEGLTLNQVDLLFERNG